MCDDAVKAAGLDKDIAIKVKELLNQDKDLFDPTSGWHLICGSSFSSAITCQTNWYCFFDLLDHHKTFLLFKAQ